MVKSWDSDTNVIYNRNFLTNRPSHQPHQSKCKSTIQVFVCVRLRKIVRTFNERQEWFWFWAFSFIRYNVYTFTYFIDCSEIDGWTINTNSHWLVNETHYIRLLSVITCLKIYVSTFVRTLRQSSHILAHLITYEIYLIRYTQTHGIIWVLFVLDRAKRNISFIQPFILSMEMAAASQASFPFNSLLHSIDQNSKWRIFAVERSIWQSHCDNFCHTVTLIIIVTDCLVQQHLIYTQHALYVDVCVSNAVPMDWFQC